MKFNELVSKCIGYFIAEFLVICLSKQTCMRSFNLFVGQSVHG